MAVEPSALALITLDEFKLLSSDPAVKPDMQPTDMDDYWQSRINQVGDVFRKYCRLPLICEDIADEEHDGKGNSSLWLRHFPVVTGTGITFTVTEDGTTLTLDTDFKVRKSNGELIRMSGTSRAPWSEGVMNVVASYRAGRWANTAAVDEAMKVLAVQACEWLHSLGPASMGPQLMGERIFNPGDLPKTIKEGLARGGWVRAPGV